MKAERKRSEDIILWVGHGLKSLLSAGWSYLEKKKKDKTAICENQKGTSGRAKTYCSPTQQGTGGRKHGKYGNLQTTSQQL